MTWDLAVAGNWNLILTEQRSVVYKNNTQPTNNQYKYTPIPPIYASPNSHVLLIGIRSNSARAHWFLGGKASQYLYVLPNDNFAYTSGVQIPDIKKLGLNRLTLVEFKNYNVIPYVLEIDIPYWLEDIYVEIWEYTGVYEDADQQYQTILSRLNAIEQQINSNFMT